MGVGNFWVDCPAPPGLDKEDPDHGQPRVDGYFRAARIRHLDDRGYFYFAFHWFFIASISSEKIHTARHGGVTDTASPVFYQRSRE